MTHEVTLTTVEAALRLKIRLDQTYRLLRAGDLEGAIRVDGQWRIPESAIALRLARVAKRRRQKGKLDNAN